MTDDGVRWQAVDPQDRDDLCDHGRRYEGPDTAVVMCLLCGAEVEPVMAEVLDLDAARWLRRRRLWDWGRPPSRR